MLLNTPKPDTDLRFSSVHKFSRQHFDSLLTNNQNFYKQEGQKLYELKTMSHLFIIWHALNII